jgi:flagellar basal-body rod protein FlgF
MSMRINIYDHLKSLTQKTMLHIHNMTNMNTPGFKALINTSQMSANNITVHQTNYPVRSTHQGALTKTNNPYNIAIEGNGYFQLQHGTHIDKTRNGQFHLDNNNQLSDEKNRLLIGEHGAITLPSTPFSIHKDGQIESNGELIDSIHILPMNDDMPPIIHQGYIEESNVAIFEEMTHLLQIKNQFSSTSNLLDTVQRLDNALIQLVGELS